MGLCQIHWSYAQIIFPAGFADQGVLNKDPTPWVDGNGPHPISLILRLKNELSPYDKKLIVNDTNI